MEVASHFQSTSGGTDSKSTRALLSRAMWRACAVTAASSANDSYRRVWLRGDQSPGAISNPSNEKPGATVQPVNVQGPRLSAACPRPLRALARRDASSLSGAPVIVPDFDRVDPVPVRALAARQQKENRGGSRAAFNLPRVAKGFAIVPALRVRLESERAYYFGSSGRGHG